MDDRWLDCFGAGARFEGTRRDGAPYQGRIVRGEPPPRAGRAGMLAALREGVVDCTEPPDEWTQGLPGLVAGGWIQKNWERRATRGAASFTAELAAADGPVCEVAAGPAGGFMPAVRERNPRARVLVNDWSPGLLRLWRTFLVGHGLAEGLCFAAFDATRPVLRPGCLAAVASHGGFGNIGGSGPDPELAAIERMGAALRPGGLLFAVEPLWDSADWAHLPQPARLQWEQAHPGLTVSFAERAARAGLAVLEREVLGGRALSPDESGLAKSAAAHGLTLHLRYEHVKARKA